jgi:hypothetical protein
MASRRYIDEMHPDERDAYLKPGKKLRFSATTHYDQHEIVSFEGGTITLKSPTGVEKAWPLNRLHHIEPVR